MKNKSFTESEFYEAYHFLKNHKIVNKLDSRGYMRNAFEETIYVSVVKVNPLINAIDDNENFNIDTKIWLEFGPIEFDDNNNIVKTHDTRLDCEGNTFEEAIITLANLVDFYYTSEGTERVNKDINEAKLRNIQFFNKNHNWILNWNTILDKYDNDIKSNYVIIDLSNNQIINMNSSDIWEMDWEEIK